MIVERLYHRPLVSCPYCILFAPSFWLIKVCHFSSCFLHRNDKLEWTNAPPFKAHFHSIYFYARFSPGKGWWWWCGPEVSVQSPTTTNSCSRSSSSSCSYQLEVTNAKWSLPRCSLRDNPFCSVLCKSPLIEVTPSASLSANLHPVSFSFEYVQQIMIWLQIFPFKI